MSVSYGGDSIVFADGSVQSGGWTGMKNRIINGAMVIDQRNVGASITPSNGQYSVDRWKMNLSQSSKYTVQQNAGSVTPPTGFTNYLGVTSSSAYSVLAADSFYLYQAIEGYNIADLGFGTATAQTVTVSFWVRSSLTGSFGGSLAGYNGSTFRSYPFSYTINSANTWEYKTVTIPGDTTTFAYDKTNSFGFFVTFSLGVGTTSSGTANTWTGSLVLQPTGSTSVVGTNGATWYVTGVQLERGSTASSFEYRPYGTEKLLCMRYYEKTYNDDEAPNRVNPNTANALTGVATSTTNIATHWKFSVPKRASATVQYYSWNGTGAGKWANISNADFTVTTPWGTGYTGFARLDGTGFTAGAFYWGFAAADAEL